MAKTVAGSVGFGPLGRGWLVGILGVVGMFALAFTLSPGLWAEPGDLVALGAVLGEVYATGVRDFGRGRPHSGTGGNIINPGGGGAFRLISVSPGSAADQR